MTPMGAALPPLLVRVAKPVTPGHAGCWLLLPLALTRPAGAIGPVRIVSIGSNDPSVQLDLDLLQQDVAVRPGETYRFTLPILVHHARELELSALFVEVADPPELVPFPSQLVSIGPSLAREIALRVEALCAYEAGTKVELSWQHGGSTPFDDFAISLGPEGAIVAGKIALRRPDSALVTATWRKLSCMARQSTLRWPHPQKPAEQR
jgi:hypothetical protein